MPGKTDEEIEAQVREDVLNGVNRTLPSYKKVSDVLLSFEEFPKTSTRKIIRKPAAAAVREKAPQPESAPPKTKDGKRIVRNSRRRKLTESHPVNNPESIRTPTSCRKNLAEIAPTIAPDTSEIRNGNYDCRFPSSAKAG